MPYLPEMLMEGESDYARYLAEANRCPTCGTLTEGESCDECVEQFLVEFSGRNQWASLPSF